MNVVSYLKTLEHYNACTLDNVTENGVPVFITCFAETSEISNEAVNVYPH